MLFFQSEYPDKSHNNTNLFFYDVTLNNSIGVSLLLPLTVCVKDLGLSSFRSTDIMVMSEIVKALKH